jgi:UDP-N-acetyl-D-glucosamine dehydrogenase
VKNEDLTAYKLLLHPSRFKTMSIISVENLRHYDLKISSVPLTEKNLKKYDCVVISTDHSFYDYNFIAKHSRLVVDTRNAIKGVSGFAKWKIIKA